MGLIVHAGLCIEAGFYRVLGRYLIYSRRFDVPKSKIMSFDRESLK